jgi:hypothetical protein
MLSEFVSGFVKKSALRALKRMMESTPVQDLREETMRQPRRGHAHLGPLCPPRQILLAEMGP